MVRAGFADGVGMWNVGGRYSRWVVEMILVIVVGGTGE